MDPIRAVPGTRSLIERLGRPRQDQAKPEHGFRELLGDREEPDSGSQGDPETPMPGRVRPNSLQRNPTVFRSVDENGNQHIDALA